MPLEHCLLSTAIDTFDILSLPYYSISKVEDAFQGFLRSYSVRGILDEAHLYMGSQYLVRKQIKLAAMSFEKALQVPCAISPTLIRCMPSLLSYRQFTVPNTTLSAACSFEFGEEHLIAPTGHLHCDICYHHFFWNVYTFFCDDSSYPAFPCGRLIPGTL